MKLFKVMTLFAVMLVSMCSVALAETSESLKTEKEEITRVFIVENGEQKELSLDEYNLLMQQNEERLQDLEAKKSLGISEGSLKTNNTVNPFALMDLSYYNQAGFSRAVLRTGLTARVSVPVYNETSQTVTRTISYSASQSYTSNVSLSSTYAKNAFTAGVTVGASWSSTYSGSDSVSQPIPPKKYSWMEYTPYMDNSWGTMHEEVWNFDGITNVKIVDKTYFLDVYIARKGNAGLPDGIYTVKESSTKPQ